MIGLHSLQEHYNSIKSAVLEYYDRANRDYCTEAASRLIQLSRAKEELRLFPEEEHILQLRIAEEFASRVSHMLPRNSKGLDGALNRMSKPGLMRVSHGFHDAADAYIQEHSDTPHFDHNVMDLLGRQLATEHVNQFMDMTHPHSGLDDLRDIVVTFQKYRLPIDKS